MNCEGIQNVIESLSGEELKGDKRREIGRHLAECARCAAWLSPDQWVELLPVLDETVAPSEGMKLNMQAKLNDLRQRRAAIEREDQSLWSRITAWEWPRQLATVGALTVLIVAGVYFINRYSTETTQTALYGEYEISENLPLLQEIGMIDNMELLEDFESIEHLSTDSDSNR
jgi:anti-sigma-K factor RskA